MTPGQSGPVPNPVRVLIADDQQLLRAGFRVILDSEPDIDVIGEAVDGVDAVAQARSSHPDIVLMDIQIVAETTVKTHVARILTKLGVRDRVQAVVLAYESGFVTRSRLETPSQRVVHHLTRDAARPIDADRGLSPPGVGQEWRHRSRR